MNKKVSTIFAMAALVGGSVLSSAYAQSIAFPIADKALDKMSSPVILRQGNASFGILKDADGKSYVDYISDVTTETVEQSNANNYTWNVITTAATDAVSYPTYMFVNAVTGDTLSFEMSSYELKLRGETFTDATGASKVYSAKEHGYYTFSFGTSGTEYAGSDVLVAEATRTTSPMYVDLSSATIQLSSSSSNVALYSMNVLTIEDSELNALYNGKGFNLDAKKISGISADIEDNLFYGSETIWAFDVTGSGYTIATNDKNEDLIIPAGTYFFTNPVFQNGGSVTSATASQINWLQSTLIAVSPTQTGESTDTNRAAGEGFKLITVTGSEFLYITNTSKPQGDDIWINNACFKVTSNYTEEYPYAIYLDTFYYQKSETAPDTTSQSKASVYLGVTSYHNSEQSIGTVLEESHVFGLSTSSLVEGIGLLNTTKTPAIYTVKFVSGNSNLNNKYLTVGANTEINSNGLTETAPDEFRWEAKGAAIADTVYPVFQFVITAVDDNNYVTFTNRETGKTFKTQLFAESGENRYSMSVSLGSVTPFTVNTVSANTYAVEEQTTVTNLTSVVVELTKLSSVDRYAGFLNASNGEIRTLAFARDANDTSNKLYATAYSLNSNRYGYLYSEFTNDTYSAAQWQLVKKSSAETLSRVFVYNNTTTESVDDVVDGDKVSAYKYALEYVVDGEATGLYLKNSKSLELKSSSNPTNDSELTFIIKENVDGSVSLIASENAFDSTVATGSNQVVAQPDAEKSIEVLNYTIDNASYKFTLTNTNPDYYNEYVYTSASVTNEVKTYLDASPVDISWKAEEGYVTIKSDLGNYISMNEDRDGIVINENDAEVYYLYVTDKNAIVPSFYITAGNGDIDGERMYMFNPTDSVSYYVATGSYDRVYQWSTDRTKVMFKAATINESRDTLTMNVKGETKYITSSANDNDANIWGGIKRFKWQIIEADDADGYYRIRQVGATTGAPNDAVAGPYLSAWNDRLTWSDKDGALLFEISDDTTPTANESVTTSEVKIVAADGAVNIKNAAGKNVVISTILGQIVANETLTSDNATISVPSGIVIVSVEGEDAVKANVK